jgi:hypothetical protein
VQDFDQTLTHTFIVDNIEIVDDSTSSIKYCIHLTGSEFTHLQNHVSYSDYNHDEKRNIVNIVKDILVSYGRSDVDESFNGLHSGVEINYVSNGNDTVQTSVNYLM